jgi:hypothetical protein
MSAETNRLNGRRVPCLATACVLTILFGGNSAATAFQSGSETTGGPTLVKVEEDWVALVGQPETPICSPQITNIISPDQSLAGVFGLLQVNHRSSTSFLEGGLQVQGWVDQSLIGNSNVSRTAKLYRSADNLRYTVTMEAVSGGVRFGVQNGRSRTWGRFADTPVTTTVPLSDVSLADYSPDFSLANTQVNLGAHRIDIIYINNIRKTFSDGTTETDSTDRVLHRYQLSVADVPIDVYEANPDDYNQDITEVQ